MWKPCVLAILFACKLACGSLLEINETQYGRLPALYALDDWARCMSEPDGVYCTLDAALHSDRPSNVLNLLREYSAQTLKHYNHSEVHRGLCVTRSCSLFPRSNFTREDEGETLKEALQACVNDTIFKEYGLEATVTQVRSCRRSSERRAVDSADMIFAGVALIILILNLLGTGYHILIDKYQGLAGEGNRFLLCFSLKRNWGIINFDRTQPREDMRLSNIAGIEGFRVLTLQGVIFSHVLFIYLYSYVENPQAVEKMYDHVSSQAILNGPLWIQIFFSIGAFLLSYTFLIDMERSRFSWWTYPRAIIVRWMRLTPMALFALGFTMTWFAHMGSGPQWDLLVTKETEDCRERWWYHLLYIHNHIETGKFCMGHTWYLACDLQLVVYGMMAMLLVVRYPLSVYYVFGGSIVCMVLIPFTVVYLNSLQPIITAQSPEAIRHLFAGSGTVSQLYIPGYMNLSGYVFGLITGYLHYNLERKGIQINQYKSFNLLFHLSLVLCNVVVFTGTLFLSDSYVYSAWSAALYAALDRTLVALFVNVFLLGMFNKCKSGVCSLMEWRGFQVLGRLTYCAYLVHFLVLRLMSASSTSLATLSALNALSQLISTTVLTYAVSLPLALMIEYPLVGLEKAFTSSAGKSRRTQAYQHKRDKNANIHTDSNNVQMSQA